jgi:PhnB protein
MATAVKPIPDGYDQAIPYITCRNAAQALEFYSKAFGATETMRMAAPDGKIGHAEIKIGNAIIMLSDEYPEMKIVSPQTLDGTPVGIHVYVPDVDALAKHAVAAGATVERPIADQFYGDRSVTLADPFGHRWFFATHKEDVPPEELAKRAEAAMKG